MKINIKESNVLCLSCKYSKVLWKSIKKEYKVMCRRLGDIDVPILCIYYRKDEKVNNIDTPIKDKNVVEKAVKKAIDEIILK